MAWTGKTNQSRIRGGEARGRIIGPQAFFPSPLLLGSSSPLPFSFPQFKPPRYEGCGRRARSLLREGEASAEPRLAGRLALPRCFTPFHRGGEAMGEGGEGGGGGARRGGGGGGNAGG